MGTDQIDSVSDLGSDSGSGSDVAPTSQRVSGDVSDSEPR